METKRSSASNRVLIAVLVLFYVLSLAGLLYGNYMVGDSATWQMIVNGILLSIPLILLYFLIYVLVVARQIYSQAVVDQNLGDWGHIDILINNSGVEPR